MRSTTRRRTWTSPTSPESTRQYVSDVAGMKSHTGVEAEGATPWHPCAFFVKPADLPAAARLPVVESTASGAPVRAPSGRIDADDESTCRRTSRGGVYRRRRAMLAAASSFRSHRQLPQLCYIVRQHRDRTTREVAELAVDQQRPAYIATDTRWYAARRGVRRFGRHSLDRPLQVRRMRTRSRDDDRRRAGPYRERACKGGVSKEHRGNPHARRLLREAGN